MSGNQIRAGSETAKCLAADRATNLDNNENSFNRLRGSVQRLADTKSQFLGNPVEVDEKDSPSLFHSIGDVLQNGPDHLNDFASMIDAINDELRDRLL